MTEIKNELASYEKSLNSSSSNVSSSSNNSNSDQKALVDQLTKEIETLKYSKTSNENLLNPRSDSRTINEANASLERIKVKMAELELRLADAKSKCGQTCVTASANAVIDGYKKDYATLKNDLATANNNIDSNQKTYDRIKDEYYKKQIDPKTKEAKWSPNQQDLFMTPSREAEKQLAIWKDKKATIEKQMSTIKEK